mmetsp:Transcript_20235/g.56389  ORF Transcript_20235/g.56389 Transcript_20235/m.56389 type:complete len:258 (-) Transcript_20235:206-979(-)
MTSATLLPLCIIEAMHSRPLSSWSATFRNRLRGFAMSDLKVPSASTCEKASSRAPRGTRTWSNHSLPLSTPLQPILWPMSSMRTPLQGCMFSSLIRTKSPCTPWLVPWQMSCAKTTAHCAWTAPFVIQYFCESVLGVCTTNSWVEGSYVAVVPISTALLPKPSSVSAKQPTSEKRSMPLMRASWWRFVPNFSTVPPNRLNWTVIFVDMEGSQNAATSCAAKTRSGLCRKSTTDAKPARQIRFSRSYASSLSSCSSMS